MAEHLSRSAFVYVRQSTADQLVHNQESSRRQYGLAERARQLGWTAVEVIDDDLGRSGGGVNRPGFERLLAAICEGRVGAVLAIEASRLARNGRDWHTLIEFCGLVGTVIVDEDGIYDPRHPNDRLLLGMKGTMSELELSLFRQRSQEALKQKARRGALFLGVAAGYVRVGRDRIEKDPNARVQDAIRLVFDRFSELQSVRQVHLWLRDQGIALPVASHSASDGQGVIWRLPLYNTVHNILTNPVYAGAYAFGRTASKVVVENGRKRIRRGLRRPLAAWDVLLKDQHEGYIGWSEFEKNQQVIADNATGKGALARGAVRSGDLLLVGLLRCGQCGRKMYVGYGGKAGRYYCQGANVNHGTARCISFGSFRADQAVGAEVLRILKPLGVEAAVKALEAKTSETSAARRQLELALQQARFAEAHARRQYDAVDPANRLVAGELERRWNGALQVMRRIEGEIAAIDAVKPIVLGERERQHLLQLGADLERAWSHPAATTSTRKRIMRAALHEIVVRLEADVVELILHWHGGDHTALKLKMNGAGKHRWTVPDDTLSLVREVARLMPDQHIARLLNRASKPTGRGNGWTKARVCSFRHHHRIPVYRESEWAERGEITLQAAADMIDVSVMTASRMLRHGIIRGHQLCKGAPWVIKENDMAEYRQQNTGRRPLTSDGAQQSFGFQ
ncbi:recombinase family protein [Lichenifustis flavocetrariae]|uniref:Recombinase family protein n=1 Tax=Lichenifustis flavocetrariae TaxID=2949735 RepID=A0AA42CMZ8_9HYPH|nr:recombinase family protein [Lichenifustis flavocetrariae]MCW6513234.1 recombinase family protein [Lichenifustis flavocetrariae]